MWRELDLTMRFTVPLCGSVPRDPDIIDRWVDTRTATEAHYAKLTTEQGKRDEYMRLAKLATDDPEQSAALQLFVQHFAADPAVQAIVDGERKAGRVQSLEEVKQERQDTVDPLEEVSEQDKVWVGFSKDKTGLFVRGANLRAHLKDCASVVAPHAKKGKVPDMPTVLNFRSKAVNAIYIKQDRLHIVQQGTEGEFVVCQKATAFRDATLSVMTAQGPRTCLKRVDYIEPAFIRATILLYPGEITRDWIKILLDYGCVHGFGQDRSLQFGRYQYELGE